MIKYLSIAILAIAANMSVAIAQIGDEDDPEADTLGDVRVRTALDEMQLDYRVVSNGKFKIELPVDTTHTRTQVILINSQTETVGKFEIREVWSPGYRSKGPLPRDVANTLLLSSFDQKLGAWQTMRGDSMYMAVYAIKLSANADTDALRTAIRICVQTADALEKELTNADEF